MNQMLKDYAKISGVKLWQIADALGMQDSNFSKKLRKKLLPCEENTIIRIIDQLAAKKQEDETGE